MLKQPEHLIDCYWALPVEKLFEYLQSSPKGLSVAEAENREILFQKAKLKAKRSIMYPRLFLHQFSNSIVLILIVAAILSLFLRDSTDAVIILVIILASSLLGFWQESKAANALKALLALIRSEAKVLRDGKITNMLFEKVVPGDVVFIRAGDQIPADGIVLECKDLLVNEASLTGESFAVSKSPGSVAPDAVLTRRPNSVFLGTYAVSGLANILVTRVGRQTELGKISGSLEAHPPETEFEKGIRHFGYLILEITLILVFSIFAFNVYFKRDIIDSLLFSLALAVGLTPQLLPAIIMINLSRGAKRMASHKVIVKRLSSIEDFGSMDILCSDKTGTLTEGQIIVKSSLDPAGNESKKVGEFAFLNAYFQESFSNPIDEAIRKHFKVNLSQFKKIDEIPYDFSHKRLTVAVTDSKESIMITKGTIASVLSVCTGIEQPDETTEDLQSKISSVPELDQTLGTRGLRTLGIAYKKIAPHIKLTRNDEKGMIFLGFLVFSDPLKKDVAGIIRKLEHLGITLKVITGDNARIAKHLTDELEWKDSEILTGSDIHKMNDASFMRAVLHTHIFAEIEPHQKERIVRALKKGGKTVGFIGDGINDAAAIHAADVGISVNNAADVTKEAADIILLKKSLSALQEGVVEGRRTFINTMKYIFMATSANFGNMFSMAGASLFLPFLPLLPKQILATNLLTDFPETTISTDSVDREMVAGPKQWDIRFIRKFMIVFGILSSFFDYLTFIVLLLLKTSVEEFRTGWFLESVISAASVVLVIRSRRPFFKSKPSPALMFVTGMIVFVTLILPFTVFGRLFGFTPVSPTFIVTVFAIVISYVISAEIVKFIFYRRVHW